jgi:hypothetical protein
LQLIIPCLVLKRVDCRVTGEVKYFPKIYNLVALL